VNNVGIKHFLAGKMEKKPLKLERLIDYQKPSATEKESEIRYQKLTQHSSVLELCQRNNQISLHCKDQRFTETNKKYFCINIPVKQEVYKKVFLSFFSFFLSFFFVVVIVFFLRMLLVSFVFISVSDEQFES
jgi:Ca2+-dependent lipid-binding protein